MSAVGQTSQPSDALPQVVAEPGWRASRRLGQLLRHLLTFLLWTVLLMLGLLVLGAAALSWRLAQGPLDVTVLAREAEKLWLPADAPTKVAIGTASITWNGFDHGADHGLEFRFHDLRLVDRAGTPGAQLENADLSLSFAKLLELHVVPRTVSLDGLRMRAVRSESGDVRFDLAGLADTGDASAGPSLADLLSELRRPARTDQATTASGTHALSQLNRVRLHDVQVVLVDQITHKTWTVDLADLAADRRDQGGVTGTATGTVDTGMAIAALNLKADLLPDGGTHVAASLAPVQAASLAQSAPALAPIGALDAKVQATASLDLSPAMLPRDATVHVAAGSGTFALLRGMVNFDQVDLDATSHWTGDGWRPAQVSVQRAQVVLPSPSGGAAATVVAKVDASRHDGAIEANVDLGLDHVAFADLGGLWPQAWGGHVRPWLVDNVTGGIAHDGHFTAHLTAPEANPTAIHLVEDGGTVQAEDLTIHWLRPVPPVEHARAVLTVVGPDVIDIAMPSGSQGASTLKDGTIRFTGLMTKDQYMALTTGVVGSVPDVLALLRLDRLNLLSKHPLPITRSAGTLTGTLSVNMLMKKEVKFEQIGIEAKGHLASLTLGGLVAGRDLTHGDIGFDVTQDGLQASGPATVAGFVGTADVMMNFRKGASNDVTKRASMRGHATAAQLRAANADPAGLITGGSVDFDATYTTHRDGAGSVELEAGLGQAGLSLLNWKKAPGAAAAASATLILKDDKLAGVQGINARGPGLLVVGRAEMVDREPRLLRLERAVLGDSSGRGEILLPADHDQPIRITLAGPQLDLSSQLGRGAKGDAGGVTSGGKTAVVADLRFDRVILAKGRVITGVTAVGETDRAGLQRLDVRSTGPERIRAILAPQGLGRRLQVWTADAGTLFQSFDVTDAIHGGSLYVMAEIDDRVPQKPISGKVDLSDFSVHDAVTIGKLLQAVTIYGIPDALQSRGVYFTRLIAPFRYDRQQLFISEARAYSASLGLTAEGWLDFSRSSLDIRGTIVPAYVINSALGRVPLVGHLFSPEKDGGLVSVNYGVTGHLADPGISVNPLSVLTPGILRRFFNLFD